MGEIPVPATEPDSVRLALDVPTEVGARAGVRMTLRVENITGRSVDLYLRGRTIAFDLVVTAPDGRVVWRRLEGELIPAILRIETLPAGASLELQDTWAQRDAAGAPVPPGSYRVRGEVLTEGEPLRTPVVALRIR